jgi:hypothetical protein
MQARLDETAIMSFEFPRARGLYMFIKWVGTIFHPAN